MTLDEVENVLRRIRGCTFASLDAITYPRPGIRKETISARVILFTNKHSSGYENMVRRRLLEAGKNPDNFVLQDLPWGTRIPETPLIVADDKYYLQTIVLHEGDAKYFIGTYEVDPVELGLLPRRTNQGLPPGEEVLVSTYSLKSLTRLAVLGEEIGTKRTTEPGE